MRFRLAAALVLSWCAPGCNGAPSPSLSDAGQIDASPIIGDGGDPCARVRGLDKKALSCMGPMAGVCAVSILNDCTVWCPPVGTQAMENVMVLDAAIQFGPSRCFELK